MPISRRRRATEQATTLYTPMAARRSPLSPPLALGVALSMLLGRALASVVRGVSTTDLVTLGAVAPLLLAASAVAVVVPSRRAARVHPSEALASE
ncbi:MAG TPA: hypothetical protein VGK85_08290 [Myxococcaceae bacterium]|jgi:ABC-type antimicrobial peptide transport system permease subunit